MEDVNYVRLAQQEDLYHIRMAHYQFHNVKHVSQVVLHHYKDMVNVKYVHLVNLQIIILDKYVHHVQLVDILINQDKQNVKNVMQVLNLNLVVQIVQNVKLVQPHNRDINVQHVQYQHT